MVFPVRSIQMRYCPYQKIGKRQSDVEEQEITQMYDDVTGEMGLNIGIV